MRVYQEQHAQAASVLDSLCGSSANRDAACALIAYPGPAVRLKFENFMG
ncbi:MAG TPA: hypothetical protein VHS56_12715 [Candidatus Cybelea sp.]|nr:hypothetical protein [Candidatus Cybelea sp.]